MGEDLRDVLRECSQHMTQVSEMWPGANDEERTEMRSLLSHVVRQLEPLIEARDIPWGAFTQAMGLMAHASHNLDMLHLAQYTQKLSHLERELRAATTDDGWDAYLKIDTLKSDEAARCAARQCPRCTCRHELGRQFMTSRSS